MAICIKTIMMDDSMTKKKGNFTQVDGKIDVVQEQLRAQIALRKAGIAISSTLDLETIMAHIAKGMGQVIDATSAYINTYEPTTNEVFSHWGVH